MNDAAIEIPKLRALTGWHNNVPLWWVWSDPCPHCGLARCDDPAHSLAKELPASAEQKPKSRPTPAVVVEAIMWAVRQRGPKALQEPANIERLRRCDQAALEVVDQRLSISKRGGQQ